MTNSISKYTYVLLLCAALPIAGCTPDNLMAEDDFEPYGGSKQYPIKVSNGRAYVEECGAWPKNLADTEDNRLHYNHGCAVQANIAAMAAYPDDLVGKRKLPSPSGDIMYSAIDRTRVKPSTGSGSSSSGGGAPAAGGTP
jgi:type IV pilus biogenesis protein CpaD/CtpE